jgi:hypothetical protein
MPFNRKGTEIGWYAYDATPPKQKPFPAVDFKAGPDSNKIETPRDLIKAINKLSEMEGKPNIIASTFGRWQTKDEGVLIPQKAIDNVPVNAQTIDNKDLLRSEEGYQVYIGELGQNEIVLKIFSEPQVGNI